MTSSECGNQVDLTGSQDVLVARMGGFRDQNFQSALDQLRTVVFSMVIPETTINMLLLKKPVTLNEHVNTVCIPSITW